MPNFTLIINGIHMSILKFQCDICLVAFPTPSIMHYWVVLPTTTGKVFQLLCLLKRISLMNPWCSLNHSDSHDGMRRSLKSQYVFTIVISLFYTGHPYTDPDTETKKSDFDYYTWQDTNGTIILLPYSFYYIATKFIRSFYLFFDFKQYLLHYL